MLFPVGQLRVDLVADDKEILLPHHLGDGLQILLLHNGARRIVREGQNQDLRLGRNLLQKLFPGEPELILCLQLNHHRNSAGQNGARHIGHIAWLRDQHLVARIQHGPQRDVNGLTASDGDHDLTAVIVFHLHPPLHVIADFHLQLLESCIGGVEGFSHLK